MTADFFQVPESIRHIDIALQESTYQVITLGEYKYKHMESCEKLTLFTDLRGTLLVIPSETLPEERHRKRRTEAILLRRAHSW